MQVIEGKARHVLSLDRTPLAMRHWAGRSDAPVAFLGHSQPTYSAYLTDLASNLNAMGLSVWTGDLRGHGASSSATTPLGYLHRETGWDDLIADATIMTQTAFSGVPWEDRLLVMPNINALLTLEMLKGAPDLARSIVLISPPPNQKALSIMARAFVKGRMMVQDADAPDEFTLHHLYAFLGAHLENRQHLLEVSTPDRAIIDRMVADPLAHPTPTLGYWLSIFNGFGQAWDWPKNTRVKLGMRVLVLYGAEDAMTAMGRFVKPMTKWFNACGVSDVTVQSVSGGRSALFLDEKRLSISRLVMAWHAGQTAHSSAPAPIHAGIGDVSSEMLEKLGLDASSGELRPDALVELCYNAIEDETRWVEMLYRVARDIARRRDMDEAEIEATFARLMPHWDRSYKVNRQIMTNAALGVVLQNVIERFDIGMVLLTRELEPVHYNSAYCGMLARTGLAEIAPSTADEVAALTRQFLDPAFRSRINAGDAETVLVHNGHPVGVYFCPPSLRQTALQRGGPAGILIVRHSEAGNTDMLVHKASLLQLAYGLTVQEAMVALHVTSGQSTDSIALTLDISMNTMRTHLKRVYEKVGVAGQTELAARILSGPIGWLVKERSGLLTDTPPSFVEEA